MYSEKARARRRCTATRKDGAPCRAYACWDDPLGRCMAHAGRHHTGPIIPWKVDLSRAPSTWPRRYPRAQYVPCTCSAYPWPHRPGGGRCTAPELEVDPLLARLAALAGEVSSS
jgi:hypothetical protein